MIDIHSHIIPGVDDGPETIIEFFDMANHAVMNGITNVIATPHHLNGCYYNTKDKIIETVLQYQKYLQNEGIPLIIHPGQEIRLQQNMFKNFELNILTLNNKGKYLLIELPSNKIPTYIYDVFYELKLKEVTPIIVHPERNKEIENDPNLLIDFIHEGVLLQITAGSILGNFGKRVKSLTEKLIEHRMVHFIASDAHNCHTRNFALRDAYELVTKNFGKEFTLYYKENAQILLKGESVEKAVPIQIKKKILGIF